jgi:hypothetical protein
MLMAVLGALAGLCVHPAQEGAPYASTYTMEEAGLLVADQLAAWIGHGLILPPAGALANPQNTVLGRRKIPTLRFLGVLDSRGLWAESHAPPARPVGLRH